ncbi:DUF6323 family protein [Oscillibacter sp.]|uniref:DUF6323 family protein n=1 Tax=Oscillibacter sp. TaxID=1945593 RepID=UPI00262F357B|nr:DUF6323 family protein [Oscillibacter sp.]MDD3347671.1 DUF6323 family protein [Oscillibacter sp.]
MEELSAWEAHGLKETIQSVVDCNARTARFGLSLSREQAEALAVGRSHALRDTGRVEFGGGILSALIDALCSSPFLQQETYADTLETLQEVFYHWKNELDDTTPDRALLSLMRRAFDEKARGALLFPAL